MKNLKQGDYIQLERRGFFYVDKLPEGDKKMTLHFVPDGRSSNMSKIKSKLDQKEVAGGKAANNTDKKKAAPTEGADGEQKLSKKELNKLKKKENKANAKANAAGGGKDEQKDQIPSGGKPSSADVIFSKHETTLEKSRFLGGENPT